MALVLPFKCMLLLWVHWISFCTSGVFKCTVVGRTLYTALMLMSYIHTSLKDMTCVSYFIIE